MQRQIIFLAFEIHEQYRDLVTGCDLVVDDSLTAAFSVSAINDASLRKICSVYPLILLSVYPRTLKAIKGAWFGWVRIILRALLAVISGR